MNQANLEKLRALAARRGADVVLACGLERCGVDRWLGLTDGLPVLPPFHRNGMVLALPDRDPVCVAALRPHPTDPEQLPVFTAELLDSCGENLRLGVVNPDRLNRKVWEEITDRFPHAERVDLTEDVGWRIACSGAERAETMAAAAKRYDRLFSAVPMVLQPERTEREAVNQIRHRALELGADAEDLGLLTQVWLTSAPLHAPERNEVPVWPGRRFTWGDRINLRVAGALPEGVCAGLGRCYVMGPADVTTRRSWELAVRAEDAAAAALKPKATLAEAMAAAERTLEGTSARILPGVRIHGVGYHWLELPQNADDTAERPLQKDMTLTVDLPVQTGNEAPFCCMDVFRVTPDGGLRLTTAERELRELFT